MIIPIRAIPKYNGKETTHSDMADNKDIRNAIFGAVPEANEQVKEFAKYFGRNNQRETCKAIFDFLKHKINYVADGSLQLIKLPSALLHTKVGDCKSYSLLTSAILTNLGIPHHFVLVSYNSDPTPSHIYVETEDGCIIDAVWGIFDDEKKPTYRYEVKPNGKMKVKSISGTGKASVFMTGCGCGCNTCGTKTPYAGIGAFELDEQSRNFCNNKYPVDKRWWGDANKLFREACYLQERIKDEGKEQIDNAKDAWNQFTEWVGDLNLKKFLSSPFRQVYLGLVKFNVDGYATQLSKNPTQAKKLQDQFIRWGGDATNMYNAIKDGASKKPLKVGLFNQIKIAIKNATPKGVRISGIGSTDQMTQEEQAAFYTELARMGLEKKPWNKMTKEEKTNYYSKKLMTGALGTTIRGGLIAGGGAAAVAVCSPMNLAAAVCAPIGGLVGEAVFGFIPDLVAMTIKDDPQYNPTPNTGGGSGSGTGAGGGSGSGTGAGGGSGSGTGTGGGQGQGDGGDKKGIDTTTMLLIGAAVVGGVLLLNKK